MTDPERLEELLVQSVVEGLTAPERAELDALLEAQPDADEAGIERAAAAVCLAALGTGEPLPESVRQRIEAALGGNA